MKHSKIMEKETSKHLLTEMDAETAKIVLKTAIKGAKAGIIDQAATRSSTAETSFDKQKKIPPATDD